MTLPQMNPLAAKLMGGADYRRQLQQQLLASAEKTDDPGYRQRLIEVAHGKRPLRTLMQDPAFLAEKGMAGPAAEQQFGEALASAPVPEGTPDEIRARLTEQMKAQGIQIPSMEEAAAIFEDVVRLQSESDAIVAADRLTGWAGSEVLLAEQPGGGDAPGAGHQDGQGPA